MVGLGSSSSLMSVTPFLSCQKATVANCSMLASVPKNRNRDSRICEG